MISIKPTMRRVCALSALAVLPIALLAGCGGGGGGGGDSTPSGPPPTITSLSPATGSATGGTIVTINGTNFGSSSSGLTVKFVSAGSASSVSAASVTYISSNSIKVTAPPGSGVVDIQITTGFGTSTAVTADRYTYFGDGPPAPPI